MSSVLQPGALNLDVLVEPERQLEGALGDALMQILHSGVFLAFAFTRGEIGPPNSFSSEEVEESWRSFGRLETGMVAGLERYMVTAIGV